MEVFHLNAATSTPFRLVSQMCEQTVLLAVGNLLFLVVIVFESVFVVIVMVLLKF